MQEERWNSDCDKRNIGIVITIKGTYSSSLVTLTSDNPFVISKPFLRNGQRHIPFVTVRIPSFFLHELITGLSEVSVTNDEEYVPFIVITIPPFPS
jgi:hypothetical protein